MAGHVVKCVRRSQLDGGRAFEEFLERDPSLQPGQMVSRAQVHAVTEGQVRPEVRTVEIDDIGVVEDVGISVGGSPQQLHQRTRRVVGSIHFGVHPSHSEQTLGGRLDPEGLLYKGGDQFGLGPQRRLQFGVRSQQPHR